MSCFSLSVVMPTYNEARTLARVAHAVLDLKMPYPLELIVVDDGSTDQTARILRRIDDERLVVHTHPANLGKGAAVLSGAALARGSHLVVFDADGEYEASDLARMAEAILSGRTSVVYGTRLFGMNSVYQSLSHALGNKMATLAANLLFNCYISDLHTCLKMMPVALFRELHLSSKGFGLDSEITGELLRRGHRPFEVPVSYVSRSRAQGKKLQWWDGIDCILVLARVRARGRIQSAELQEAVTVIDLTEPALGDVTEANGHRVVQLPNAADATILDIDGTEHSAVVGIAEAGRRANGKSSKAVPSTVTAEVVVLPTGAPGAVPAEAILMPNGTQKSVEDEIAMLANMSLAEAEEVIEASGTNYAS